MLDQQKQALIGLFTRALTAIGAGSLPVTLERPKLAEHGDVACTVALQSAKILHKAPRQIAEQLFAEAEEQCAARYAQYEKLAAQK